MKRFFKKLAPIIAVVPFIIGAAGYFSVGESLSDSLYAGFALYFVNPVSDAHNIPIEIARWSAALVTTTAVLCIINKIRTAFCQMFICLGKDSIAVYCGENIELVFDKPRHSVIYPGKEIKPLAKSHIIMLDSDSESIKFYEDNRSELDNREVYIVLKEIEYGLIKECDRVQFFDFNGAVARVLWKQIKLWEASRKRLSITILGTHHLGQNILNYGLLLNLYSPDQEITYHFIGSDRSYQTLHGDISTYNKDNVIYHSADDDGNADIIHTSDIVILSENVSADVLQTVALLCMGMLYYYSPALDGALEQLNLQNVKPFGNNCDVLTDENVRGKNLISDAMKINYLYAKKFGEECLDIQAEWDKLNGFLKWSNISSADFVPILNHLGNKGMDIEILSEFEHIRWCRFHVLNFWRYGEKRDNENKIHNSLLPFSELSENDKEKDRNAVKLMLGILDGGEKNDLPCV